MAITALNSAISSLTTDGEHSTINLKTILAGSSLLAKALKAFATIKHDADMALAATPWASIAKAAKLSESDAVTMILCCGKDSALRVLLRALRADLVAIGRSGQVLHDATICGIDIVTIDRIVSALAIIDTHKALLLRPV